MENQKFQKAPVYEWCKGPKLLIFAAQKNVRLVTQSFPLCTGDSSVWWWWCDHIEVLWCHDYESHGLLIETNMSTMSHTKLFSCYGQTQVDSQLLEDEETSLLFDWILLIWQKWRGVQSSRIRKVFISASKVSSLDLDRIRLRANIKPHPEWDEKKMNTIFVMKTFYFFCIHNAKQSQK